MEIKEIKNQLYELRRQGRERYLEFMGVDVKKVRALEKELDAKYETLAAGIQEGLKDAGKGIADQHQASLKRVNGQIHKDIARMVEQPYARADIREIAPQRFATYCYYYPWPALRVGHDDSVTIDPPASTSASGSVTYNAAADTAQPKVDSGRGQGTGTITSAQVNTSFRFAFTPTSDGTYCIRPLVYMNGHWLVWTWGTCGGTPEDRGNGRVMVKLRLRVDQLSIPVKQVEHPIIDQNASAGADLESGFGYDSEVEGGASLSVYLQGGHEAVAWVECEIFAQIENHGRAWVDMQSSPFFHFEVPELYWGPMLLIPIGP